MVKNTLSDRINWLFDNIRHPNGKEYTNTDVARIISISNQNLTLSRSYLCMLRSGATNNPSIAVLKALITFFNERRPNDMKQISLDSFFDDINNCSEKTNITTLMKENALENLVFRARDLSPESLKNLTSIVEKIREIEKIPDQ